MNRKILIEPDPILRKKCEPLEKVDDNVRKLMKEMLDTMYKAPGIGLAAIQIGILKRLVVIDISKEKEKKGPFIFNKPRNYKPFENEVSLRRGLSIAPRSVCRSRKTIRMYFKIFGS